MEGTMKAVVLDAQGQLAVCTVPIPQPASGQVLVRIEASPINPCDLLFLEGNYPLKPLPCTLGFEGSGTVIASGGGFLGWTLVGKNVAVLTGDDNPHGCWAEYSVVDAKLCATLDASVGFDQGSSFFVNPMTVMMFMELITSNKHKSVIQSAAASTLGKMLLRCCIQADIPLINIVRREESAQQLRDLGAVYVLNSSDDDFVTQLNHLTQRLETTIAFDAVGGRLTGSIFNALRPQGTVYVYGLLSGEPSSGLNASGLVFHGKTIEGALLGPWLASKGTSVYSKVGRLLTTDLRTDYSQVFSLEQIREAIDQGTDGKVLIKPRLTS